ncbi:uncharacterized protein [Triticum aestivum]|uniref:uncharacterized protein n=1 Tax=Triticum aestivum TaxID=4565 RepID=UPI001D01D6D3|nr:uncharacterized protein LOC123119928 [Triticum aestivum]
MSSVYSSASIYFPLLLVVAPFSYVLLGFRSWSCSSCSPGLRVRGQAAAAAAVQPVVRDAQLRLGGDPVRQVLRRGVERVQGEDPYDDLDACCREHDSCLEKKVFLLCRLEEKKKIQRRS